MAKKYVIQKILAELDDEGNCEMLFEDDLLEIDTSEEKAIEIYKNITLQGASR